MTLTLGDTLIVATRNQGKSRNLRMLLLLSVRRSRACTITLICRMSLRMEPHSQPMHLKAKAVGDALGLPVLADDSGLCVDALNGAPGVYSARYAGEHGADEDNNEKLLSELEQLRLGEDTEQPLLSPARFVCVLVLYDPVSGEKLEAEGSVEGWITSDPSGKGGFGYDPLFYLPSHEKTMAELSLEEKQEISHRGKALRKLVADLQAR